ncbi:hypothetical protein SNL152K_10765 [Streptomyces sp. NL15-2K]|nr:hypothetical protein SNL152K_10765 [Streptomyces sp. NL15-2K]
MSAERDPAALAWASTAWTWSSTGRFRTREDARLPPGSVGPSCGIAKFRN